MAAILIGIDLCHSPLLVGCQISSTLVVQEGSKGAKLDYSAPKGMMRYDFDGDNEDVLEELQNSAVTAELFECFEDARSVAKSYFGSPDIRGAVVVVPNDYDYKAFEKSITEAAERAFLHILQVIPEHIAVAAAYSHKTKPTENPSTITIISCTAGECDVYRVSLRLTGGIGYRYQVLESPENNDEESGHQWDEQDKFQKMMRACTGDMMFSHARDAQMGQIEPSALITKQQKEEKVVFVGKSTELLNMRKIINKGFTLIKEWKDTAHDSDQLAVYGAVEIAFSGKCDIVSFSNLASPDIPLF